MLPVERVKKSLNHTEPDFVPIDLGGILCLAQDGRFN